MLHRCVHQFQLLLCTAGQLLDVFQRVCRQIDPVFFVFEGNRIAVPELRDGRRWYCCPFEALFVYARPTFPGGFHLLLAMDFCRAFSSSRSWSANSDSSKVSLPKKQRMAAKPSVMNFECRICDLNFDLGQESFAFRCKALLPHNRK